MRWILALVLCLVPITAPASAPRAVLVLGDSLSAAHNLGANQGWVHVLKVRLGKMQPARSVINASISGETTAGGRSRLPELLKRHQPALLILELGANDGLRGLPLAQIRSNLEAMLQLAAEAEAEVLLLGIELPVNYGPRYRDGLRSIYADLAQEYDTGLVPFLLEGIALDSRLMQADGLHPNAQGQARVFDNVWQALEPMLDR